MSAYSAFAEVYDQLMDDFDYPAWADYYLALLARLGVRPASLCDCACGTGSLSVEFARRGVRVTGADLSGEMLAIAADKVRAAGQRVMFVREDMCALRLPKPVDALVCGCDGVNYLLGESGVKAFFSAAHAAIRPGGALAFDVSSPYKLETVLGGNFFGEERDDVAYLWSNRFDRERRTVRMDLTFFRRAEGELFRRFRETHVQRAHTAQELTDWLAACGFSEIQVFGDRTFAPPGERELRLHFAARRE